MQQMESTLSLLIQVLRLLMICLSTFQFANRNFASFLRPDCGNASKGKRGIIVAWIENLIFRLQSLSRVGVSMRSTLQNILAAGYLPEIFLSLKNFYM